MKILSLLAVAAGALLAQSGFSQAIQFQYSGTDQAFKVPASVFSLHVKIWGAGGGVSGGSGAYVEGNIPVTPGETLTVVTGQGGGGSNNALTATYGGGGGTSVFTGVLVGQGGGRSAIRRSTTEVVDSAGGGGGSQVQSGSFARRSGGFGGVQTGGNGDGEVGGTGATQTNGGTNNGVQFAGGTGGAGGGGGWFGGGGGSTIVSELAVGSGGGGSSLVANLGNAISAPGSSGGATATLPPNTGDPDYIAGVGTGAPSDSTPAGNGLVVIYPVVSQVVLNFASTHVVGGNTVGATITLATAASSTGQSVAISYGSSLVTGPAKVKVAAFAKTATFTVATSGVDSIQNPTATATLNGFSSTKSVEVDPAQISNFITRPTSVYGGSTTTVVGTVTLNGKAGPSGLSYSTSSDSTNAVPDPTGKVAAGAKVGTFNVNTKLVAVSTKATITASTTDASLASSFTILAVAIQSVTLDSTTVNAGTSVNATVTLNQPAPVGGFTVAISSPTVGVTVPASVIVPAGATSVVFPLSASSSVTANEAGVVSATFNGFSKQASFNVIALRLISVALNPTTVKGGDTTAHATFAVTLSAPAPAGGLKVSMSTSDPSVVVQTIGTFAAGETTHKFAVTTKAVTVTKSVQVKVTYNGGLKSAFLVVTP